MLLIIIISFGIVSLLAYKLNRQYGENAKKKVYVLMTCYGLFIGTIMGVMELFDTRMSFISRLFFALFLVVSTGLVSFAGTYRYYDYKDNGKQMREDVANIFKRQNK